MIRPFFLLLVIQKCSSIMLSKMQRVHSVGSQTDLQQCVQNLERPPSFGLPPPASSRLPICPLNSYCHELMCTDPREKPPPSPHTCMFYLLPNGPGSRLQLSFHCGCGNPANAATVMWPERLRKLHEGSGNPPPPVQVW
jgi:hypothetical protein